MQLILNKMDEFSFEYLIAFDSKLLEMLRIMFLSKKASLSPNGNYKVSFFTVFKFQLLNSKFLPIYICMKFVFAPITLFAPVPPFAIEIPALPDKFAFVNPEIVIESLNANFP